MTCLDRIRDALVGLTGEVYHLYAHKPKAPYIVWAEDGQAWSASADNRRFRWNISGTIDLYTRNLDSEPLAAAIPAALSGLCGLRLNSIQFEDNTGLLHTEWVFAAAVDQTEEDAK